MASPEDSLAPDHFDWADQEEVLTTASLHDHHLRTPSLSSPLQQAHQPETTSTKSIATATAGEELLLERVESSAESGCTDSISPAIVQTTTSTEKEEELPRSSATTTASFLMHEAYNTFGWRDYSVGIEPEIHHFNWLGDPVYQHSSTAPADSLAIILADPKVPEARDNVRVQTLLRCAYTFLDPVVVTLEGAQPHLLLRRGSRLQQAATGLAYKHYTPHGRWAIDAEEDPSEVLVDSGCIYAYFTPTLAVGNGFAQPAQIRSSTEWAQARATKLASLTKWSPPRNLEWKPRSSPLCQVTLAFDGQPRLRRKPGCRLLRVEEETQTPVSPTSSIAPPSPTPFSTPSSTSLSSPAPSPLPSPPFSPSSPLSPLSTPPAAPPRPVSAQCPASSKPSPTVGSPSMDPSRDPNTYWSFPPPTVVDGKPRRSLRRALKRGFKTLLSAAGIRKSSVDKVSRLF